MAVSRKHFDVESILYQRPQIQYMSLWVWKYASSFHRCRFSVQIYWFVALILDFIHFILFSVYFSSFEFGEEKKKLIRRLGERKTKLGTAGFWLNVFRFLFYCVKNKRLATPQNAHRMPNRTVCFREKCSPFTIINWKNAMASARYCHHQNIYQPQKRTHNQRDAPNDERWNLNYLCRDAATAAYGYLGFTLVRNGIFSCSSQSPSAMVFCCFKSFHQLKFMTEIEHTEHKAKDLRLRWETTLDWTIVGCSLCDWWCRNWCLLLSHGFRSANAFDGDQRRRCERYDGVVAVTACLRRNVFCFRARCGNG